MFLPVLLVNLWLGAHVIVLEHKLENSGIINPPKQSGEILEMVSCATFEFIRGLTGAVLLFPAYRRIKSEGR